MRNPFRRQQDITTAFSGDTIPKGESADTAIGYVAITSFEPEAVDRAVNA